MHLLSIYYVPESVLCPGEQMRSETAPAALHELAHGPVSQGGGLHLLEVGGMHPPGVGGIGECFQMVHVKD